MAAAGSPALLPMLLDEPGGFSASDEWASCTSTSAALDALLAMSDGLLDGLAADTLPSGETDADVPRATTPAAAAPVNDSGYGASAGTASSSLNVPPPDADSDDPLLHLEGFLTSIDGVEDMENDGLYDMPLLIQAQRPRTSPSPAAAFADDPWMGVNDAAGQNVSPPASPQNEETIYVVPPNVVRPVPRPHPSSKVAAGTHGSLGTSALVPPRSTQGRWVDAHDALYCMHAWLGR